MTTLPYIVQCRSLVEALYRAQRLDLVDVVIELLQTLTPSEATPPPSQTLPFQATPPPSQTPPFQAMPPPPQAPPSQATPPSLQTPPSQPPLKGSTNGAHPSASLLQLRTASPNPSSILPHSSPASPSSHRPLPDPPQPSFDSPKPSSNPLQPSPNPPQASSNPPQASVSQEGSALVGYGEYLKERYEWQVPIFSVRWPPSPTHKVSNLAMIKEERVQRGEISDEYVRMTITGKVDDILHKKVPVKLEDIFKIDRARRKVILIEGAPGSGKSTLSWDICKRWGAGELFQEYEVVILVQLRDPEVQAATGLKNILPSQDRAMAESVARRITACKGRRVLFVLDGWDELPCALRKKSLFRNLIEPQLQDDALSNSTVVVTSRPISSEQLHHVVTSRVEIVGFTPKELRQYFSECLSSDSLAVGATRCSNGDSQAVEALIERVEENPVVASSCYLPLNAAIIVHLFLSGNQALPTTVHGIFTSLVLCCLSRYQTERLGL